MIVLAFIGAKALYLLFVWLISAAAGSWISDRKGYGERVGLAFGSDPAVIPLPHPSGQSRWMNDVSNRARLEAALRLIGRLL